MAHTIEYITLDPVTLEEVSNGGQLYKKTTTSSGSTSIEAVNGHLDTGGNFIADAFPLPQPQPDEIALLKEDNANLNLQIIDLWETLLGAGVL